MRDRVKERFFSMYVDSGRNEGLRNGFLDSSVHCIQSLVSFSILLETFLWSEW